MNKYVVKNGYVEKCKELFVVSKIRMNYTTLDGTIVFNSNPKYQCDEFGKSVIDGEYYNFNDIFFPWKNGIFDENIIKEEKLKRDKVNDLILLIKLNYPLMLEKEILLKAIYLVDWKYTLVNNKSYLNVNWFLDNKSPNFNQFKYISENIENINSFSKNYIEDTELIKFIDFAYEKFKRLTKQEFTRLIFSTYPIIISKKFDKLNLLEAAKYYKDTLSNKDRKKIQTIQTTLKYKIFNFFHIN